MRTTISESAETLQWQPLHSARVASLVDMDQEGAQRETDNGFTLGATRARAAEGIRRLESRKPGVFNFFLVLGK